VENTNFEVIGDRCVTRTHCLSWFILAPDLLSGIDSSHAAAFISTCSNLMFHMVTGCMHIFSLCNAISFPMYEYGIFDNLFMEDQFILCLLIL